MISMVLDFFIFFLMLVKNLSYSKVQRTHTYFQEKNLIQKGLFLFKSDFSYSKATFSVQRESFYLEGGHFFGANLVLY